MKKEITCFEAPKIMEKALDVGEAMLCTGAEISRVEDTILRICHTYGGGEIGRASCRERVCLYV